MAASKTKLDEAIDRLCRVRRRLESDQPRLKRRAVRCKFIGALRSVRLQLDREYPRIEKPAPPPTPKPARPVKLALPFVRAWSIGHAELFAAIAGEATGMLPPHRFEVHEGAVPGTSRRFNRILYRANWSDGKKWRELITWFGWSALNVDLWRRFWSEPIPVSDLALAAEHSRFLDTAAKRSASARKALAHRREIGAAS